MSLIPIVLYPWTGTPVCKRHWLRFGTQDYTYWITCYPAMVARTEQEGSYYHLRKIRQDWGCAHDSHVVRDPDRAVCLVGTRGVTLEEVVVE